MGFLAPWVLVRGCFSRWMFTHRVFQEGASCTCASLLYIYLYTPLQVCVTVQGCVGLCVCGLGWVEMAGCDQPLPLLMLFQARLKITHLPLPAETKVLPREFTPPVSTLLASHDAGCCLHPLPPWISSLQYVELGERGCPEVLLSLPAPPSGNDGTARMGLLASLPYPHTTNLVVSNSASPTPSSPI